jgi:hypothetical protein
MMLPPYLGLKRPVNCNHSSHAVLETHSRDSLCDQAVHSVCLVALKNR